MASTCVGSSAWATSYYASLTQHRNVFEGRIPDHLLSVACDQGSAQVCIDVAGDSYGTVWVYDPECELDLDEGEAPHPDLLLPVCGSFTELLDILKPQPSYDEMMRRSAASDEAT